MKNIATILIILLSLILVSCESDVVNIKKDNVGFTEYQYSYLLNGVSKTAFKRGNLKRAFFKLHKTNSFSQELKDAGFRQVEVFIVSEEFKLDSLLKPYSQQTGTSYVQISFVDSLGNVADNQRLLPYQYNTISVDALAASKKPSCVSLKNYLNMRRDTISNTNNYEYNFLGQNDKSISIIDLGGGIYQIITNGIANGKLYNVYYIGEIKQEQDFE